MCQFHKSYDCLSLPGFDVQGKAPDTFTTEEAHAKMTAALPRYRSPTDFIVGYHKPRTALDEDWGVKVTGMCVFFLKEVWTH